MRKLLWLASALLLAGCASAGTKVSEQQAQSFQVGKSTYAEVVATLGNPTSTTTSSNGNRIAVYSYAAVQSQPQNFIPVVNRFASGYDTKKSAVAFNFDAQGILTHTSSTQGEMAVGTNLAATPAR